MAKNNEPSKAVVVQEIGTLDRPSFIPSGDLRGQEHFSKDDIQLPRLALGQGLSPQLDPTSPKYIDGLKMGQMYDNLTGHVYGNGPMHFAIIRADPPRGVEFFPRGSGGGVKDFNVPLTDIRMQFTKDEDGKTQKPRATKFYDYVIVLLKGEDVDGMDMIAMSLKGSGLRQARSLNGLVAKRNAPIFAGRYEIRSEVDKNSKGTFGIFLFKNAGWVSEAQFHVLEEMYKKVKGKDIPFEREPGDDSEDDEL